MNETNLIEWRQRDKKKTVAVAITLCLNIGVDPPDVIKPQNCSLLEAWLDPFSFSNPSRAIEQIGKNLLRQYEVFQPRARYKLLLDASVEDVKKFGLSFKKSSRSNALNNSSNIVASRDKQERLIFHYNGHGVPKPTKNGELWVFNKNFTQYIPVSIVDLIDWIGPNALYILDCSNSGHITEAFENFMKKDKRSMYGLNNKQSNSTNTIQNVSVLDIEEEFNKITSSPFEECYFITATNSDEILPFDPDLPADLLTCCLTTPIQTSLLYHVKYKHLNIEIRKDFSIDMIHKIPGKITDRRSFLGELNWIYTAITDTIAWDCIMNPTMTHTFYSKNKNHYNQNNIKFQKLYRQDLLLASMFRNYLLAVRVLNAFGCTPISIPKFPIRKVIYHPLWESWDIVVDHYISQLPDVIDDSYEKQDSTLESRSSVYESFDSITSTNENYSLDYKSSSFFTDQLKSFETYLKQEVPVLSEDKNFFTAPLQLPIVLQVLLSQNHRITALRLICEFVNLGIGAINASLSVGIFPYVLKLLQSPSIELKPYLIFIWFKLISIDSSCQIDLAKDSAFVYFLNILQDFTYVKEIYKTIEISNQISFQMHQTYFYKNLDYRAMSMYIISIFCSNDFAIGKKGCLKNDFIQTCYEILKNYVQFLDSKSYQQEKPDLDFTTTKHGYMYPSLIKWTLLALYQTINGISNSDVTIKSLIQLENSYQIIDVILTILISDNEEIRVSAMFPLSVYFRFGTCLRDDHNFLDKLHYIILEITVMLRLKNYTDGFYLSKLCYINVVADYVDTFKPEFICVAYDLLKEKESVLMSKINNSGNKNVRNTTIFNKNNIYDFDCSGCFIKDELRIKKYKEKYILFLTIWKFVLLLTLDRNDTVSKSAQSVVDYINVTLIENLEGNIETIETFLNIYSLLGLDEDDKISAKDKKSYLSASKTNNEIYTDAPTTFENLKNKLKKSASLTLKSLILSNSEDFNISKETGLKPNKAISSIFENKTTNLIRPDVTSSEICYTTSKNIKNHEFFDNIFVGFVKDTIKPNFPKLKHNDEYEPGSYRYNKNIYNKKEHFSSVSKNTNKISRFENSMRGKFILYKKTSCTNGVLELTN